MKVADASILCDFVLGVPEVVEAVHGGPAELSDPLYCPSFADVEALNALRGLERSRKLTSARAERAVRDLGRVRMVNCSVGSLSGRMWELRHNLTAYDAAYLALAERMRDGVLLTRDRGLAKAARAALGDARVQLV